MNYFAVAYDIFALIFIRNLSEIYDDGISSDIKNVFFSKTLIRS